MTPETIDLLSAGAKLLAPLGTAIAVLVSRISPQRGTKKKSKLLDDLEFLSSFLAFDVKKRSRLVVEQAFATHMKHKFDFEEIEILLGFKNPSKAFGLFKAGRSILEVSPNGHFVFRKKFEIQKRRTWGKAFFFGVYLICFYVGFLPVLYAGEIIGSIGWLSAMPLILWPLFMISLSISSIQHGSAFSAAEDLLREQDKSFK